MSRRRPNARIARELLALFPDPKPDIILNLRRGEGESLWALGQREAAEAAYGAMVERLPDEGWAYIRFALIQSGPRQMWLFPSDEIPFLLTADQAEQLASALRSAARESRKTVRSRA